MKERQEAQGHDSQQPLHASLDHQPPLALGERQLGLLVHRSALPTEHAPALGDRLPARGRVGRLPSLFRLAQAFAELEVDEVDAQADGEEDEGGVEGS